MAGVACTILRTPGTCYRITFELTGPTGTLSNNEFRSPIVLLDLLRLMEHPLNWLIE